MCAATVLRRDGHDRDNLKDELLTNVSDGVSERFERLVGTIEKLESAEGTELSPARRTILNTAERDAKQLRSVIGNLVSGELE